ncbi:MAG: lysophospholipid acyltransferase family protein [Pelagibacteraceae bacterium]|jgi:hypothetical protein|nr:lysophospholipid acyltransferase family protein [Pelagibacteraceae bacterium]MDP6785110.1 lysophospholipid acyltransferase family protein [Alphaproteobacteria bacterium]MBO6466204.1 lysophospholipid acyltransferase family protein [Pelagibacteraceae bacterium]MBO6467784.1 lysophospholipid acyltransferase family protein [Pelagibacteraceae bacterium]MBO6478988.1 lysophospholipid acyltransferase family protein [Pelagibacteraceae bacterium]|tara:strand:+ start:377 stop:1045 length:669 start_codon:yes stop_codon:yes gene_type:complete
MRIKKKLLRNFFVQNILGFFTFLYIRTVNLTSSIQFENETIPKQFWNNDKPFILAFWHSQLMMIGFSWKKNKNVNILASGHSDGKFGAIVGKYFNLNNIQTSKKNKSISLKSIFKLLNDNNYIGITPDGPRGPKEIVSEGIIKIAKSSKVPIIPIGFWSSKNFKLKSWDSFLITLPFSKCSFVWSKPLEIPNNIHKNQIQYYQKLLQEKINQSVKKAQNNCQ